MVRNEKGVEIANKKTSRERRSGKGAELGLGGSGSVVRCRRRKSVGLGHWPLPYIPSMGVSFVLASGCQSQNIIADVASQDTSTCEDLLRLLASAVGGPSGWCIRQRSWDQP